MDTPDRGPVFHWTPTGHLAGPGSPVVVGHAAPGAHACRAGGWVSKEAGVQARAEARPLVLTVAQHVQLAGQAVLVRVAAGVPDPHALGGRDQPSPVRGAPRALQPHRRPGPRLTSGQVPRAWSRVTSILVMMLNTLPPWVGKGRERVGKPPHSRSPGALGRVRGRGAHLRGLHELLHVPHSVLRGGDALDLGDDGALGARLAVLVALLHEEHVPAGGRRAPRVPGSRPVPGPPAHAPARRPPARTRRSRAG